MKNKLFLGFAILLIAGLLLAACQYNEKDNLLTPEVQIETEEQGENIIDEPTVEIIEREEKTYWTGTIDDDFDGSTVLIMMDKYHYNGHLAEGFFGDFAIVSVNDITVGRLTEDGRDAKSGEYRNQSLAVNLPEDNKEQVVNMIRYLEKKETVKYTGPNFRGYITPVE